MAVASSFASRSAQGDMLTVDMAEMRVTSRLTDHLVAYGLGACIGICLYDPSLKVAGMAHIVLPERRAVTRGLANDMASAPTGKFVESAIPLLMDELNRSGGQRGNLRAAIAGGSQIFSGIRAGSGLPSALEIGARNVLAVRTALQRFGIPLCAEDVGGSHGRTLVFRVSDGAVIVKPIGGEARVLSVLSKALVEVSL